MSYVLIVVLVDKHLQESSLLIIMAKSKKIKKKSPTYSNRHKN
jgi:hypothetical protein